MKKSIFAGLAVAFALSFTSSCASGPNRTKYTWDTWRDTKYSESAWLHGALLQDVIPVYGFVSAVAVLADYFVFNVVQFWGTDAWDNVGTTFVKTNVEDAPRTVEGIDFSNGKDEE